MTIPRPRPAADDHWCDDCFRCTGCAGGDALPAAFEVKLLPSGELRALCLDCRGAAWLCRGATVAG